MFDETNLVSRAGLVPVVELTEQAGVSQLLDDHVRSGNCMTAIDVVRQDGGTTRRMAVVRRAAPFLDWYGPVG